MELRRRTMAVIIDQRPLTAISTSGIRTRLVCCIEICSVISSFVFLFALVAGAL
jgi:hypothetical protein